MPSLPDNRIQLPLRGLTMGANEHACSKPPLMLGKLHGQHRDQHFRDDDAALIAWRVLCVQNAPATALEAVFSWVDPSRGH
jgi:hypothetical protein